MKKLLLSTVAVATMTAGAMAADLPRRYAPPPPAFAPVPVFTWTGFYVGLNAGYGFSNSDNSGFGDGGFGGLNVNVPGGVAAVTPVGGTFFSGFDEKRNRDGFVGGGQVGFNYQFTPGSGFVVGIEADIQWADFGKNRNNDGFFGGFAGLTNNGFLTALPVFPAVPGSGIAAVQAGQLGNVALFDNAFGSGFGSGRGNSDYFGTVRARVGYAFDRMLIYATGGFAWTNNDRKDDVFGFGGGGFAGLATVPAGFFVPGGAAAAVLGGVAPGAFFVGSSKNNDWGWTIGGGVEYAFTNNLTVKLEGLYVNFDKNNDNNGFFGNGIVGVSNTGAAITRANLGLFGNGDNNNDFFIVRAGINYKFGTF